MLRGRLLYLYRSQERYRRTKAEHGRHDAESINELSWALVSLTRRNMETPYVVCRHVEPSKLGTLVRFQA